MEERIAHGFTGGVTVLRAPPRLVPPVPHDAAHSERRDGRNGMDPPAAADALWEWKDACWEASTCR
jgi:hypothetical protein